MAASTNVFAIAPTTGSTSGSTAWTAGAAQVETGTAAGSITLTGNASVIVTAAGMTGSPKTISVAVTNGDTAATWAGKVRTALASDADVSALFSVGGSTTAISLTRLPTATFTVPGGTLNLYAANDATINISLDNGTCTGITTAATSANTTTGVLTAGTKVYDGDQKDAEGEALPVNMAIWGYVIKQNAGSSTVTSTTSGFLNEQINNSDVILRVYNGGIETNDMTFTADAAGSDVTISFIASEI